MRGVAYAFVASVALLFGALTQASAGCYGECNGYQETSYGYDGYGGGYDGPRGHTVYYERGPEIPVSYTVRSAYYDDGYGYRGGYGGYRSGYVAGGSLGDRTNVIFVDILRVVEKATDEGRFPVIDAACGAKSD